jgi:hypothetical protein
MTLKICDCNLQIDAGRHIIFGVKQLLKLQVFQHVTCAYVTSGTCLCAGSVRMVAAKRVEFMFIYCSLFNDAFPVTQTTQRQMKWR